VVSYILVAAAVLIGVLLVVFRKTMFVKVFWKYIIILIPGLLILAAILCRKHDPVKPNQKAEDLTKAIEGIKDKLIEVNSVATVEIAAAKEQNSEKLEQLKKVTEIADDDERRKQLADLLG